MSLFGDDDEALDEVAEKQIAAAAPSVPDPRANTDLSGHEATEQQLIAWWASNTMPHTLILAGPQGIGKATLAFRLARFLFANPDAPKDDMFGAAPMPESLNIPQTHPVYAQVASGGHPDLMSVTRAVDERRGTLHDEILVDDVREVPLFLRKTAAEGGWRVVIIDEAETLNRNAQNALLKILEEPPARALLILIAQTPGALIPTIRSRARVLQLDAPDATSFGTLMRRYRPDLSAPDVELLSNITSNAPGRALALLDQGGMAAVHNVLAMLDTLPAAPDKDVWIFAEKLAVRGEPDPLYGMLDLSAWALQNRARAAADQDNQTMRKALQTLDALERHRTLCDKGNLDRRHMALGALRILQQGLKAA